MIKKLDLVYSDIRMYGANLTASRPALKGDPVIASFAVFSLFLSSGVTFTLTSFFSTILPVKRNLLITVFQMCSFETN